MKLGLAIALAVVLSAFVPGAAMAESLPPYDGLMAFQAIQGPEGSEDFSWEVQLGEDEDLRLIDDTHAGIYSTDTDVLSLNIAAQKAHAADGTNVPTTLTVTQPNVITLTVHHRGGDPVAGGAPFDYPVVAGEGWESGFQTHSAQISQSDSQTTPPERCLVPDLFGLTLKASRRQLQRAHCKLGEVRGERVKGARVARQFRKPARSLPAGTEVGVKLLVPQPRAPHRE